MNTDMENNFSEIDMLKYLIFTKLFRGYLLGDCIYGNWYTNSYRTASIYGIVNEFQKTRELKILDISDPNVVLFLRNLFIKYIRETNSKIKVEVFDSVIKSCKDGKTERNSTFIGDTYVLKSLLYALEKGWLPQDIDGFGADELSTDSILTKHHFEICLFKPENVLRNPVLIDDLNDPELKLRIDKLRLDRRQAISKNERKMNFDENKLKIKSENSLSNISKRLKRKRNLFEDFLNTDDDDDDDKKNISEPNIV